MSDAEKRELIAEVRTHLDRTRVLSGVGYEQKLMARLADALEESLTGSETEEWEYRLVLFDTSDGMMWDSQVCESLEDARKRLPEWKALHFDDPDDKFEIRCYRKDNLWEVVPDV